ncbi:M10 family metallopeptidase C-terminal domain-containing protein, partial [Tistrella mobilis]
NDVLRGRAGADRLEGGDGLDTVSYTDAASAIHASLAQQTGTLGDAAGDALLSIENIDGSTFDDILEGDGGDNVLRGLGGDDVIVGHQGRDILTGDTGADHFTYLTATDSQIGASDRITDFNVSEGDRIDISQMEPPDGGDGWDTFTFVGTGGYTGTSGEVRLAMSSIGLVVYLDVDGDRQSDASIILVGVTGVTAADFIL